MLKKLKVKNFKSLKDFEIEFSNFNVLIGENGSGKSNIIDCIEFLSDITIFDINEAIDIRRLTKNNIFSDKNISIEADVEIMNKNVKYTLSLSQDTEEKITSDEKVYIDNCTYDYSLYKYELLYYDRIQNKEHKKILKELRMLFRNFSFVNENTIDYMKNRIRCEGISFFDDPFLIEIFEDTFNCEISEQNLSDGKIKFLIILYNAWAGGNKFIAVEGIENFLHINVVWKLLDYLKSNVNQVVLTTYLPFVLNQLEPEDIIYVKMTEEGTKAMKNPEKIKELCEKYQWKIGDLWEMEDLERLCFSQ